MRRFGIYIVLASIDRFSRAVYQGISDYLSEKSLTVELVITNDESYLDMKRSIQGIIVMAATKETERIVKSYGVPVVNISSHLKISQLPSVLCDNEMGGSMAARHLLNCQFSHFGFYGHHIIHTNILRCKGFKAVVEAAGFQVHQYLDELSALSETCTVEATEQHHLRQWILSLPKPVGIFCATDRDASEVWNACDVLDIAIGKTVGIVGYGNEEFFCQTRHPHLSSVENCPTQLGYEAAKLLLRLIRGGRPFAKPIMIAPAGVIPRESADAMQANDAHVNMALQFIRAHLNEPLIAQQLFKHIPMSRRTLERRFQQYLGHSILESIQQMKIEHIRHLLETTSLKLYEIADHCGFPDLSYMATLFRKKVGMTPIQYRTQSRRPRSKA
ncbi:MAG: substrate-binding domain-containing protein [Chthoniobacterales bacterium]